MPVSCNRDEQIKEKKQREEVERGLQKALDAEVEVLRRQQLAVQEVTCSSNFQGANLMPA